MSAAHSVANLYTDHHRWLHAWLWRKLGNSFDAADLAHDAFQRLLSRDEPIPFQTPRAYLTTVAKNLLADHWRRKELEQAWLEALAAQPEAMAPSPEESLLVVDILLRIDHCLSELPTLTRRIFLRSQLDGLVYADIASELSISLPTVKRHMSRAFLACLSVE